MQTGETTFTVRVHVYPRREILDPQGKAIGEALARLGFEEVAEVRAGKALLLQVQASDQASAEARAAEMSEKLLANTVTEDYTVEVLQSGQQEQETTQ